MRSRMNSRPKSCSAASVLWAWQYILRFRTVSRPPSAWASSWWSSRKRVSRQRCPNLSTKTHCSPSRSRTSRRTEAAPRWRGSWACVLLRSARGGVDAVSTAGLGADVGGSEGCVCAEGSADGVHVEGSANSDGASSTDGFGHGAPYLRFSSRSTSRRSARRCTSSSERFGTACESKSRARSSRSTYSWDAVNSTL